MKGGKMGYKLFTEKVAEIVRGKTDYACVQLSWRVDASAILFVRTKDGRLYEDVITQSEMKQTEENLAQIIIRKAEKHFGK